MSSPRTLIDVDFTNVKVRILDKCQEIWYDSSMMKLQDSQQRLLEFVLRFTSDYGYPPSVREIGAALGLSGTAAHYHIRNLIDLELLGCANGKARTLRVTEAGLEAIA